MTHLYVTDCTPLMDESSIRAALPLLDAARQQKLRSLQPLLKRAQVAAAGLLLRYCFGAEAQYVSDEHGKPHLADHSAHFNLSHSDRWVVLAVSDTPVGVDLQAISSIRPRVLQRCFTAEEQKWIGTDKERFTALWSRKEAYGKCTGHGITAPLAKPIPDDTPFFSTTYENACIALCGDVTANVVFLNIKDLL